MIKTLRRSSLKSTCQRFPPIYCSPFVYLAHPAERILATHSKVQEGIYSKHPTQNPSSSLHLP